MSGCLMALGMRYGNYEANDWATRDHAMEVGVKFVAHFEEDYGSIVCRAIMGHDISDPDGLQAILEKRLFENKCAKLVYRAIEIAREML